MKEMAAEDIPLLVLQQMLQNPVERNSTESRVYVASFARVERTIPEMLHPGPAHSIILRGDIIVSCSYGYFGFEDRHANTCLLPGKWIKVYKRLRILRFFNTPR